MSNLRNVFWSIWEKSPENLSERAEGQFSVIIFSTQSGMGSFHRLWNIKKYIT